MGNINWTMRPDFEQQERRLVSLGRQGPRKTHSEGHPWAVTGNYDVPTLDYIANCYATHARGWYDLQISFPFLYISYFSFPSFYTFFYKHTPYFCIFEGNPRLFFQNKFPYMVQNSSYHMCSWGCKSTILTDHSLFSNYNIQQPISGPLGPKGLRRASLLQRNTCSYNTLHIVWDWNSIISTHKNIK